MHRVTQTFRDAELERAYLDHSARASRRTFRLLSALAFLATIGAWFSDPGMFGTEANVEVMHRGRAMFMLPVLVLGVAFAYAPVSWFRRGWRVAVVIVAFTMVGLPGLISMRIPDPGALDIASAYISLCTVLVMVAVVMPIGFAYVVAAVGTSGAAMVTVASTWPTYHGDAPGWIVVSAALSLSTGYQVNLRDRLAFAAQYRLDEERARSEGLLRNVLPAPIAERLKAGETRIADRFERATVLFADLVGFTQLAAKLEPEALVAALDEVFSAFDDIAARHGLEKIKTIGDAYLVVGGVPTPRDDHAVAVAEMALEIRALIARKQFAGHQLEVRIGLHSGPLVAGVIGKQKFIYDLWGDTVNTASRMESSGVAGAIQVTGATEALLRDRFTLESRGTVTVKGKGELETWLLRGPRA